MKNIDEAIAEILLGEQVDTSSSQISDLIRTEITKNLDVEIGIYDDEPFNYVAVYLYWGDKIFASSKEELQDLYDHTHDE